MSSSPIGPDEVTVVPRSAASRSLRFLAGVGVVGGLAIGSYLLARLPGLVIVGPLTVALLVGMVVRAIVGTPAVLHPGTRFAARTVLRLGIVLMGARLDVGLIAEAGPTILLLDVAIIGIGIIGISWIARRFGVPGSLATLLAVGTSICGASAVVAASSVTKAHEEDTTLAVGLCGIVGTVGVLVYVFGAPLLGFTTSQLAVLSGSTLHEVAQVMAAAFSWGTEAGDLGTLVKLLRVVLLAPALVILSVLAGAGAKLRYSWRQPPIPWFVIGFLGLGGIASLGVVPGALLAAASRSSVFLMVMAMVAMGMQTSLQMIRRAGPRVIYAGLAGFALLGGLSALLIHVLGVR